MTLRRGARGPEVEYLQQLLGLAVDGRFGPHTEAAVRGFQRRAALVEDGVVGPKTWTALLARQGHDRLVQQTQRYLGEQDLVRAAEDLEVPLAAVKAVNEVESSGGGFLPDGRVKILFEGHVFWRALRARGIDPRPAARGHETVLYARWTDEHYIGGAGEHARLEEAKAVCRPLCGGSEAAALCGASWGLFQILGENHRPAGFATVEAFVAAMETSEGEHLRAFVAFLRSEGLDEPLRRLAWSEFAAGYNGPGYARHRYDVRLARAYARHARG